MTMRACAKFHVRAESCVGLCLCLGPPIYESHVFLVGLCL